ncbi:MAG: hypothetical protein LKJ45_05330 [Oscillospiraceae bacterium]|jgi:hypothetical protein|nr:hypothetical protein [Oscillospiraceae bacterium]
MRANDDIRKYAHASGVYLWQVGEALSLADCNLSRKLRHELSPEDKAKIRGIIDKLAQKEA